MTSEVQVISIVNSPGSGKFALALDSQPTGLIVYHPAAGELQSALELLPNIGAGNIAITKDSNWVYRATFQNALADTYLNQLQLWDNQLGGGGDVQITTAIDGAPPSTGDPKQDAINAAWEALVVAHNHGPYSYPGTRNQLSLALRMLAPYQTVSAGP